MEYKNFEEFYNYKIFSSFGTGKIRKILSNKKDSLDYVDLAFPLSPVGPVARFTVSKLSAYIISYLQYFSILKLN